MKITFFQKLVVLLMVFLMLSVGMPSSSKADIQPNEPDSFSLGCVIAIVVVVVGVIVVYKLYKVCSKCLPPTPPPKPSNPSGTNSSPSGSLVATSSGIMQWTSAPELRLNDADVVAYEIASLKYEAVDGSIYHTYIPMDLVTSTNLMDWEPLSVKFYVSDTCVLTQTGTNGALVQFRPRSAAWTLDLGLEDNVKCRFVRSSTP